jgi:hypothetical protein
MNWFKHKNNAHNDPFIVDLMNTFAEKLANGQTIPWGYHVWFITLEILAKEDALARPVILSNRYLAQSMLLDFEKIKQVFSYAHTKGKLRVKFLKNEISIFCPNLKKYRDEYSEKKAKKKNRDNVPTLSRHYRDNIPPDLDLEVDLDTETDTETETEKTSVLFNGFRYFKDAYKGLKKTAYKTQYANKDEALCEKLVKTFGRADFCRAVEGFFKADDNFIAGRGYDIIAFNSVFKGLLQEKSKNSGTLSAKDTLEKMKQEALEIARTRKPL